jgi:NAD kinase
MAIQLENKMEQNKGNLNHKTTLNTAKVTLIMRKLRQGIR